MSRAARYLVPLVGAGALMTSAFSGALAGSPPPPGHLVRNAVKAYTVNGRLTVTDVLRVQKNQSVYGRQYAHGGLQVWKGLTVTSGGVSADSLNVKGALSAASGTVSGNLQTGTLQSGTMNGTSLALTGAATVGGPLTSAAKITGNGVDGGSGGLTTTGAISGAGLTVSSISDSGALAAGSITSNGSITAGSGAFGNLQVTGNVNFTNASITGLTASNLNLNGATLTSLNVGSASSSAAPFVLSGNGRSIALGVNGNGALTADSLALNSGLTVGGSATFNGAGAFAGNLSVGGSSGLATSVVQAPAPSGSTVPGNLSLIGGTIALNGNVQHSGTTSLLNGSDLVFSSASGTATHITANGDGDVAGQISISANGSTAADETASRTFIEPYSSQPYVVVTPAGDPNPGGAAPRVWVTLTASSNKYTGFTVHYVVQTGPAFTGSVPFNYHVIAG